MTVVRREAPKRTFTEPIGAHAFRLAKDMFLEQALADLAAGKHAKGCDCAADRPAPFLVEHIEGFDPTVPHQPGNIVWMSAEEIAAGVHLIGGAKFNACLRIAECARDLMSYEVDDEA